MYVSEKGSKCETVTPRNWSHCASHSFTLGEQLDESRDRFRSTLELPALGKPLGDLNSAEWESIRLRLVRTAPAVTL